MKNTAQILSAMALKLVMLIGMSPAALAADSITCRSASQNGSKVVYTDSSANDCTTITSHTTAREYCKTYVADGKVSVNERITVTGTVNLILSAAGVESFSDIGSG